MMKPYIVIPTHDLLEHYTQQVMRLETTPPDPLFNITPSTKDCTEMSLAISLINQIKCHPQQLAKDVEFFKMGLIYHTEIVQYVSHWLQAKRVKRAIAPISDTMSEQLADSISDFIARLYFRLYQLGFLGLNQPYRYEFYGLHQWDTILLLTDHR